MRKAGCAWDTQRWHAGLAAAASCGHHTCSHNTHSLGDTRPRGSVEKPEGLSQGIPGPLGAPLFLYPQPSPTHLKGLPTEVTATKLALEAPLGAVVLQVCRQVSAAQFGGAAIGAGDHIEAAGIQVTLVGKAVVSACQVKGSPQPHQSLTCRWRSGPLQRQPSSLWMQRIGRLNTWTSSSGSG